MPRGRRNPPGGYIYHILNRGNARATIFGTQSDYFALLKVVVETLLVRPMRILEFCVMPNHWHFVLWPERDGELAAFMHYFEVTHAHRWHAFRGTTGWGHVYQGPYKFFPIQDDGHLQSVCRYVVRNPLRAGLVQCAEEWPWSSLALNTLPSSCRPTLTPWPVTRPADWIERINSPQNATELARIRRSVRRGSPFGETFWRRVTADSLGLEHTLRASRRSRLAR